MKPLLVVVVLLGGCEASNPPPPPTNVAPAPELRCKTAVERAAQAVKLDDGDVTMAVGACERHEWSQPARACVAGVRAATDLVACGKQFALGSSGIFSAWSMAEALATMTRFKDSMCACKDMACVQKVSDDMSRWGQEAAKRSEQAPKLTEEDAKAMGALSEQMAHCMQNAMGAGSASP